MIRAWRSGFVLALMGAAACAPILGLDDLRERVAIADGGNGDADAVAVDAGRPCTTHAECVGGSAGRSLCAANQCVDVNTQLCLPHIRPFNDILKMADGVPVIVVAAFMRFGAESPLQSGAGLAYDLALQEIEGAGGIRGLKPYRLAMLICDSDPAKVEQSINHVVTELKVPAILAAFGSGQLADLVPKNVAEAGVFTMNPSFTTDVLNFTPTNGLVWSLLGTAEDVALAYRPLFQELKAQKFQDPNIDLKVTLVATLGSLDKPMADVVELGTRIRAADAGSGFDSSKAIDMAGLAPKDSPSFARIDIDSIETTTDQTKAIEAKQKLIDSNPDVIIALTANELDGFVAQVDDALVAKNPGNTKKPYWILGPSNGATVIAGNKTALGVYLSPDDPDVSAARRRRFFGVQYAGALVTTERDLWETRMIRKYQDAATGALASENFYDAIYWLAYGIAAAGPNADLGGKAFSDGVRKLVGGTTKVVPGEGDTIRRSFQDINLLDPVTFEGALGPPDINVAAGTWNSVGSVYCYFPQGKDAVPSYDQRRYSASIDGGLSNPGVPINCTSSD